MKTVPAAWQPYRRLRRQYWAVVAGMVMTCLVPIFVAIELNVTGPAGLLGLLLLPFGIMFTIYLSWQLRAFECPGCHRPFFFDVTKAGWRGRGGYDPLAPYCLHCGLPKWSVPEA
jgi:hypothetical protein